MSSPPLNSGVSDKVDTVIVGCGIAGALLAGRLAKDGHRVIALEKRPLVGVPVRCGEAAGSREEISHFVPIDENWIVAEINAARMYAPDGECVEKKMPGVGVMLKRDAFDQALARQASEWGAEVRTSQEATALLMDGDRVCGVAVRDHVSGHSYNIEARVTVGADGVEGFVGRWANLTRHLRPREIHSATEYTMKGDGFPSDTIELYLGRAHAPGGYAWVFPKGERTANVGLGIHPSMANGKTARYYLDRFVEAHFPEAEIGHLVAGGVSGSKPLETMVTDGLLLVGEAGRQNNPFSGGGIMNALEGAEEAHKVLTVALQKDDVGREFLRQYDRAWHDRNGHLIEKFARLRELFFKFDDDDMNRVVKVLDKAVKARPGRITDYAEVFRSAFLTAPGILWKASKLLW
jgi:digeranylgeranylglycerophospholipid reductase